MTYLYVYVSAERWRVSYDCTFSIAPGVVKTEVTGKYKHNTSEERKAVNYSELFHGKSSICY